jgi:hypothetical protein
VLNAMPFLADIDQPPRSRLPGLVFGLVLALPVVGVLVAWVIPWLVSSVLGGAQDFDSQLRAEDAYMKQLCATAMQVPRDEKLCGCVLAVEYPALDCQHDFRRWAIARQAERCADETVRKQSLSYCTCVEAMAEAVADPAAEDDPTTNWGRCGALPDAFALPEIEPSETAP